MFSSCSAIWVGLASHIKLKKGSWEYSAIQKQKANHTLTCELEIDSLLLLLFCLFVLFFLLPLWMCQVVHSEIFRRFWNNGKEMVFWQGYISRKTESAESGFESIAKWSQVWAIGLDIRWFILFPLCTELFLWNIAFLFDNIKRKKLVVYVVLTTLKRKLTLLSRHTLDRFFSFSFLKI